MERIRTELEIALIGSRKLTEARKATDALGVSIENTVEWRHLINDCFPNILQHLGSQSECFQPHSEGVFTFLFRDGG